MFGAERNERAKQKKKNVEQEMCQSEVKQMS